jgi:hypothetical protein
MTTTAIILGATFSAIGGLGAIALIAIAVRIRRLMRKAKYNPDLRLVEFHDGTEVLYIGNVMINPETGDEYGSPWYPRFTTYGVAASAVICHHYDLVEKENRKNIGRAILRRGVDFPPEP